MLRKWIVALCLGLLVCFTNHSTAQQSKEIVCIGRVVDIQGKPISGSNVMVYEMLSNDTAGNIILRQVLNTLITKDDGRFIFETKSPSIISKLPTSRESLMGGYIVATKNGFALGWVVWNMREDMETDIKLGEPQHLEGMIIDEAGKPIESAEVRAILYKNMETAADVKNMEWLPGITPLDWLGTKTNTQGRFQFNNLPEGSSIDLLVKANGKASICTYQPELEPAFEVGQTDVRIILPIESCIKGRIIDTSTGKEIPGITLTGVPRSPSGVGRKAPRFSSAFFNPIVCVSREDGTFSIGGLPEGKYALRGDFPLCDDINVESGKTTSDVIIQCPAIVQGRITESDGKPIPHAEVQIREYNPGAGSKAAPEVKTDQLGRYIYADIRWPYSVGAIFREESVLGEGYKYQYLRRNKIFSGSQQVDFQFGRFPEGKSKLAALVTDQHGKAFSEFTVIIHLKIDYDDHSGEYLFDYGFQLPFSTIDGRFEIKDLPAGTYSVIFYNPYDRGRYIFPRIGELLLEKEETANITYEVTKKSVYYGRVLFEDGSPVFVDSPPWPGAKSYAEISSRSPGTSAPIDKEGYFEAFLTDDEFEKARNGGFEMKIYYPSFTEERLSYSLCVFSVELLSKDKTQAGVVKAPKPTYTPTIDLTNAPSIKYRPLPEFDGINIDISADQIKDKMILVCFFDMNQRPSRNCIMQLAKKAEQLKHKGLTIIAIQTSKIDGNALNEWTKKNTIPFPVGMVQGDEKKTRFAWGVQSLPWLILTDKKHIVQAEGFNINELDGKIKTITEK